MNLFQTVWNKEGLRRNHSGEISAQLIFVVHFGDA